MVKVNDLWLEVENALTERTPSGLKTAILEAHKVLRAVLDSKGYPGKDIERQLFWAGYSLKDKDGFAEALEKRDEILNKFEYQLSDFEAEEIVRKYKKAIDKVGFAPKFSFKEKMKMSFETYFSPKSLSFWRNLAIFIGFFVVIKLLYRTEVGIGVTKWLAEVADFIISWQFLLLVLVVIGLIFAVSVYLANKSKVIIKDKE